MLTDRACRQAKGRDKPYKLSDAHGLYLYVTSAGYRSWRLKYRFGGKEKRLTFGLYPDVSLLEARERRDEARRLVRTGTDPSIAKRQQSAALAARSSSTFGVVAAEWLAGQGALWSAKHASDVQRSFDQDILPRLENLPIDSITAPMVIEVLRPIERRGAVETAHRTRQRISEVFGHAIGAGLLLLDPAASAKRALARVKRGKQPAVRTIDAAKDVLTAVETRPGHPIPKLASRLLALTAARPGVIRLAEPAEFEDLDGPEPIWRIPAAKMKLTVERKEDVAFEFVIPLAPQAVETVRMAIELSGRAPLIFRSVRHPRKPISDSTLSKAYRDAGYSGRHVPHGWRSTFSTIMNELVDREYHARGGIGVSPDRAIIDMMLAHIASGTEVDYNRAAYMPRRRELVRQWADMLTPTLAPLASLVVGPRRAT